MKFMLDSLRSLGTRGSKLVRLDAFGYATKKPGTRCFFQVMLPHNSHTMDPCCDVMLVRDSVVLFVVVQHGCASHGTLS